ncbi:MAG: SDR family NAD(P)-dependent oxidoreductase [Saprospiraceae bacterium]|nr:SDR family NAD(P)-dependent oxidoreductase [Saprospiraceae bacterium]
MKYIIVTGASTGIGRAIVEYYLKKGDFVFGSVRKETDATQLKFFLGDRFEPLIFDVRDGEAIKKAVEIVKKRVSTEGVALLVNNAGIAVSGPLQHLSIEEYQMQFDINVFGVQRVTQAFLPLLGASLKTEMRQKGMIINISSISSMVTTPFLGAYSASKIALEYWSDALRRELSIYNIRVVNILPGAVKTEIWGKARADINYYPETDYAPLLQKFQNLIEKSEKSAIPASEVAIFVDRIAQKQKPLTRYIIAPNRWLVKFASILPHRLVDKILTRGFT